MFRQPRKEALKYLKQISRLPCILTLRPGVQVAHIRYPAPFKRPVGMGEKPDDRWVVPLCPTLHVMASGAQHNHNERAWWKWVGVDPIKVARELWAYRDDFEWQEEIIHMAAPQGEYQTRVALLLGGYNPELKEQDDDEPNNEPRN